MAEEIKAAENDPLVKPEFPDSYLHWLGVKCAQDMEAAKNRYSAVSAQAISQVRESVYWTRLLKSLAVYNDAYSTNTGYPLFASPENPELLKKPWESFLLKTYRRNVLNNKNWPADAPELLTPPNWFLGTHDIVRTSLVVKFLDGVEFLAKSLENLASECGLPFSCDFEARDEGYYAAHSYVTMELSLPTERWTIETVPLQLEIQVTTQVQEVIRRLTHTHYEQRRSREPTSTKWQWDYRSDEFKPNYLGHILHYAEGIIMEVRDRGVT